MTPQDKQAFSEGGTFTIVPADGAVTLVTSNRRAVVLQCIEETTFTVLTDEFERAGITGEYASEVLTATNVFTDGETVTIGGLVYTFRDTPTGDFDVSVEASLEGCLENLKDTIEYFLHPLVSATYDATTLTVTARLPGSAGNSIGVSTTAADASWGDTELSGGSDTLASAQTYPAGFTLYGSFTVIHLATGAVRATLASDRK